MTGPRDMQPWEIRLYTRYRANLRTIKPDTRKGREIHKIERALLIWPLHFWLWTQRKRK